MDFLNALPVLTLDDMRSVISTFLYIFIFTARIAAITGAFLWGRSFGKYLGRRFLDIE